MIPVSLKIKGLYSYQAEQTIEFDRLLEGQLFGIFGSVGSGKSSILEAMTFALYGQSERLDRNDNRNYNMMNLKSDELLIDFCFRNFDEQEYRFTVKGRRNGKDFDKVNTFDRAAYQKVNGNWIPLESSNADGILGLSYDNFRRTVIIPQGKFQEFLQLGDKDRTNMLKEIFQLDKYEFFYQVTALEKKNNELIQHLSGQLAHYEQINSESIKVREQQVTKLNEDLNLQKAEVLKKEKHAKEQEALKKLFEELEVQRSALAGLLQHEEKFSRYSKKIKDYEYCLLHFKERLNRKKELDTDISKRKALIIQSSDSLEKSTIELEKLEKRFEEVKLDQQKQEERRLLVEDYHHLLSLKSVRSELSNQKERLKSGQPYLEKALAEKSKAEIKIENLKAQIRAQKEALPDMSVLSAVKSWHTERHNIERHINNFREELEKVQKQISSLGETLVPHLVPPVFPNASSGKPFSHYAEQVNQLRAENRQKQDALASQIAHYSVQLKLGEFAGQLSKGGPCLLCGSEHHPKLLMVDDVNEHLTQAHRKVETFRHYDESCERVLQVLHGVQQNEKTLIQQSKSIKEKLGEEAKRMDEHLSKFNWENENWKDEMLVEESLRQFSLANGKLQSLEKDLDITEKAYREASENVEKFRKALDEIQSGITAKTAEEGTLIRQLKSVQLSEAEHFSEDELDLKIHELNQKIESVKQEFEQLSAQIDEHKSARIALLERINTNRDILQKDETQFRQIDTELEDCFEKSDFGSWNEIELILQEKLDLEQFKAELLDYQQKVYNIREILKRLEDQASGKSFDLSLFSNFLSDLAEQQSRLQELNDIYVREKSVLEKQKEDLQRKTILESQLQQQQKRAANLNTMKQLFKGSGFVNYVSSVYLHNLCEAANERFYKLTRQSLRLEVTEKNEFQVRDFLNNGKVRNVKTLSGGQTFQASLSLALALAESVQQQNKSNQNFFFLDEGFGSLDKESLQVAFETLKSLRKENRKVGIISHVEELQQEIDVFLNVTNDSFSGSRIKTSWEN